MITLISLVVHLSSKHSEYADRWQKVANGGRFNPAKAVFFRDVYREDVRDYTVLYYTASGRWVLNTYSADNETMGQYLQVSTKYAETWLRDRGYLGSDV